MLESVHKRIAEIIMLRIIVKHICGHFQFHLIDAKNDMEAAKIEAELQNQLCDKCKSGDK